MRFLLKCVFWLGGVFLLMPGIIAKQNPHPSQAPQSQSSASVASTKASPDLIEQWLQAGKTLQEITTFCERNPALCVVGKATAQQAGEQAILRAKDAYDALKNPVMAKQEPSSAEVNPSFPKIPVPTPAPRR